MQLASKRNRLKVVSRRIALMGSIFGVATAIVGCSSAGTPVVSNNLALVKGFNAYVPATGADATLAVTTGSASIGSLAFGAIGGNISVAAGSFTASATGAGAAAPLALAAPATLGGNNSPYVVAAVGQAGQSGALAPQLLVIPNYTTALFPIPVGQNAVRVVNLSLNPNPLGLYHTLGAAVTTPVATGLDSLSFGYSAANGYVLVNTVQLRDFAIVDATAPTVPLALDGSSNLGSMVIQTAQAYTLYIYGQPGNAAQPLSAKWTLDYSLF